MKYPDLPANEKQRLQALHALKLLDTKAEERYDRLTRMARRAFNVPHSMLSLVDQDRQWPKSCAGPDILSVDELLQQADVQMYDKNCRFPIASNHWMLLNICNNFWPRISPVVVFTAANNKNAGPQ